MIESMYKYLGNMPVIGHPIKVAYIGKKVKDAVQKTQDHKLDPETASMTSGELTLYTSKLAHHLFNEEVTPHIQETGLPDFVINPIKNEAISKLSGVLASRIQKKITTAQ